MDPTEGLYRMTDFNLLKHIRGEDDSVVVWLFNIGIEKYWGQDISTVKSESDENIVNHMEEMNLLIAKKQDFLILRRQPDSDYIDMLEKKGFAIPNIILPSYEDEKIGISELVLNDSVLLERLKEIANSNPNVYFVPYGVSEIEERIALKTGLELIGGKNRISKMINNKMFAREMAEQLMFPVTEGQICHSLTEVKESSYSLLTKYGKIVIKYPTGASGKGLWVVEDERKLITTLKILERVCNKKNIPEEFVVERWYQKECDLNYQVYVCKDGSVEVFSIKEQLLNETVYIGSVIKPRLSEEIILQCKAYGEKIGKELFKYGYDGILGIDAMITKEGVLIPVIDINARFTLSTYVSFVSDEMSDDQILAFYHKVNLKEWDSLGMIQQQLDSVTENKQFLCYVSATVKKECVGPYGRLFVLMYAKNVQELFAEYDKIISCLERGAI